MKLYFIRHAPTEANLSGSMVNGYDNANIILQKKPLDWEEKVGKYIPKRDYILTSPVKRCIQTCELIFGKKPLATLDDFGEFEEILSDGDVPF